MSDITTPTYASSEKFNSNDANVVFTSSDNVLFKIHRKYLESGSGGFPPSGFETHGEIIPLTESSSTLELLFQYIYPMPQPEILSAPFETIAAVAEAAEKYQVYPAMYICKVSMSMALPDNAPKIFAYAGRHGHKDLLGKAAPYLIGTPLHEVVAELPAYLIVPWLKYYSAWESQLQEARSFPEQNHRDGYYGYDSDIIRRMARLKDVKSLRNLPEVFGPQDLNDVMPMPIQPKESYLQTWKTAIETGIQTMKPFSTYLDS